MPCVHRGVVVEVASNPYAAATIWNLVYHLVVNTIILKNQSILFQSNTAFCCYIYIYIYMVRRVYVGSEPRRSVHALIFSSYVYIVINDAAHVYTYIAGFFTESQFSPPYSFKFLFAVCTYLPICVFVYVFFAHSSRKIHIYIYILLILVGYILYSLGYS